MFIASGILIFAGWIWSFEFPMIKNLWTSSFVLHTSGLAIFCFAISYWFFDFLNNKKYVAPFLAFGTNALVAYFVAGLFSKLTSAQLFESEDGSFHSIREWLYSDVLVKIFNEYNASFAYSILNTSFIFLFIWWMYKKKIIIKV